MKENKEPSILYVYATEENENHIEALSIEYNLAKSVIVNTIIEAHRTGKKPVFKKVVPKYVQRAEDWKEKKKVE